MQKTLTTKSFAETIALGSKLGALLQGGEFITLTGDLGGGKTQFAKGIACGLGITETVVSPTFTIERIYSGNMLELHHFDLYRLHNDTEIASAILDLNKDTRNVVVIEWPENIEGILPETRLDIEFIYMDEDIRQLIFTAVGKRAEGILESL